MNSIKRNYAKIGQALFHPQKQRSFITNPNQTYEMEVPEFYLSRPPKPPTTIVQG
jgi:hypothetical protein